MSPFDVVSEEEIQRINRLQRNTFDKLYHLFEPPLPEGVPERLEKIVAHGKITRGDTVLHSLSMISRKSRRLRGCSSSLGSK
jgi:hypothetical protein